MNRIREPLMRWRKAMQRSHDTTFENPQNIVTVAIGASMLLLSSMLVVRSTDTGRDRNHPAASDGSICREDLLMGVGPVKRTYATRTRCSGLASLKHKGSPIFVNNSTQAISISREAEPKNRPLFQQPMIA
jgi:hypothetical protein